MFLYNYKLSYKEEKKMFERFKRFSDDYAKGVSALAAVVVLLIAVGTFVVYYARVCDRSIAPTLWRRL